jgi:RHS repeat-associated protein
MTLYSIREDYKRLVTSIAAMLCCFTPLFAQFSITGPTCVIAGTAHTYSISGPYTSSTNMNWNQTTGTITGSSSGTPLPSITVTFTTSGTVKVVTTNPTGSATLSVSVAPALSPGTISNPSQNINYGAVPGTIICAAATGGSCSTPNYTYQWQSSPNNVTYTNISGATSTYLSFTSGLTSTTYYRRFVTETTSGNTGYSGVAQVTVYPQINPGSVSPASQTVSNGGNASALTLSGVSGGTNSYSYQWQSSPDNVNWINYGPTTTTFAPTGLLSTTYFRVAVTSNLATAYSTSAVVTVSTLFPGTVAPYTIAINSGSAPGAIDNATPPSGGNCGGSYVYQWQSSTDGVNFTNISGAVSPSYLPGTLTAGTWYRRQATCGTLIAYSNICQVLINTGTPDMNFVRARAILKAGVQDSATAAGLTSPYDVSQVTQYFDGLGRPMQSVAMQESPLQHDLVSLNVYDNYGREATKFLPYPATTNDGNYKVTAQADDYTFNSAQYSSEQYYFSQINFEASPLNRAFASYSPGANWQGSQRGIGAQYSVNQTSDSVRIWNIAYPIGSIPTTTAMYPAGSLYKTIGTDEAGHQVVEYKDKTGHMVLKKAQLAASPGTAHVGWLCTYYVYDDLDYLRFVIQPQAVVLINASWGISTTIANELCFRYEYDAHNHMIVRKIPGAGETWMVYDIRDRLVMTQDSLLRSQQKWLYMRYDSQNRPDSTGLITDPTYYNQLAYQDTTAFATNNYPVVSSYTNELLIQTYYDDYSWAAGAGMVSSLNTTYTANATYFNTSYNTSPTYAVQITQFPITRGMATGGRKEVIGSNGAQYLYAVNFYDDRGRLIQSQDINYTGVKDTITLQYDFTGKPIRSLLNHAKGGNTAQSHTVLTKMDYDQGFRLRHIWKNIDGAASDQLIDSMQYNELGQLNAKYLGNNLDSLVYVYNVRGWLSGINPNYVAGTTTHYFGMELGYDKTTSVAPGNSYLTPEYNGNIEGTVWKTAGSGINRKYDFTYDPVNRIMGAAFLQNTSGSSWDKNQVDFSVSSLSYDANGNILSMTQKGFLVGGSQSIDVLSYGYLSGGSNKLTGVTDAANNATSLLGDFHYNPSTKQSTDYNYDGDGNLTQDNNKAITSISYNCLNLPQLIHFQAKGNISYVYDASGDKLAKITIDSVAQHSVRTLYIDGFVYQQTGTMANPGGATDTLQFISHEEGRARWAYHKYLQIAPGYRMEYDFFEKDHLGNTRMILTQEHDTSNYIATMEYIYRATESQIFGNIASTCTPWTSIPNYQNIPSYLHFAYTNPNDSVSKVDYNGTTGQTTGPSLLLKVMSGDTITPTVQCYYASNTLTATNSSLNSVLNTVASGIMGTPTGAAEGTLSGYTSTSGPVYGALSTFLSSKDPAPPSGYPKAYLNWILLDDQFNYVSGSSGSVATASTTYPANQMNLVAPGGPIVMSRNGYLYVWVSNETQGWDVFFDNFLVQYKQGPVLEENHYYPFGLTMAGISDKAVKTQYATNKYRYNGKELQNQEFSDGSGLEESDYGARLQDPQLGVWHNLDPLADKGRRWSPYNYAMDNPMRFIDPDGMQPVTSGGVLLNDNGKGSPGSSRDEAEGDDESSLLNPDGVFKAADKAHAEKEHTKMVNDALKSAFEALNPPNKPQSVGLANTDPSSGSPDVAAAAGPAPTTAPNLLARGTTKNEADAGNEPAAPPNNVDGPILKSLCGDYTWKSVGESWTAEVTGLYFYSVQDIGSKNPDVPIRVSFDDACITIPKTGGVSAKQATQMFNSAWNATVVKIHLQLNSGKIRFEDPTRTEMKKILKTTLSAIQPGAAFSYGAGCAGSIPSSFAKYCDFFNQ